MINFLPLLKLIRLKFKNKNQIALYYPTKFELNVLKILEHKYILDQNILLLLHLKKFNEFCFMERK